MGRHKGPDLGHRDLVFGQQFQQHRLECLIGTVHLVDEQDHGLLGAHRLQQWARGEETFGEEDALLGADPVHGLGQRRRVGNHLADLLPQHLCVEQLFAVVPLVECRCLVLALVALQPQEFASGDLRQGLGELGLADAGGALEEDGLSQPVLKEDRGRQSLIGEIACGGELLDHIGNIREITGRCGGIRFFVGSCGRIGNDLHAHRVSWSGAYLLGGRGVAGALGARRRPHHTTRSAGRRGHR